MPFAVLNCLGDRMSMTGDVGHVWERCLARGLGCIGSRRLGLPCGQSDLIGIVRCDISHLLRLLSRSLGRYAHLTFDICTQHFVLLMADGLVLDAVGSHEHARSLGLGTDATMDSVPIIYSMSK